jgi:hypothetical protein
MFSINQTDEELRAELSNLGIEWDNLLEMTPTTKGRTVMLTGNETVIRIKHYPKYPEDNGVLSHEVFHAVTFILNHIGMKLCRKSDEAYAYLTGYLTTEIYKALSLKEPTKEGI